MFRPPPSSPLFPYTTLFRSYSQDYGTSWVSTGDSTAASGTGPFHASASGALAMGGEVSPRGLFGSWTQRSEEHTSELQSQSNLVCRLLLEKKKTKKIITMQP